MNKLFWIVCEDKNMTLFEGRFQGRTRGAAIKFLKTALGRTSLKGLVFTISEIPVHLIREIVAEMLSIPLDNIGSGILPAVRVEEINLPENKLETDNVDQVSAGIVKPTLPNGQAAAQGSVDAVPSGKDMRKVGNPGHGDDFWSEVHAFWTICRSIKETSIKFELSQNSVKTRARRDGWRRDVSTA